MKTIYEEAKEAIKDPLSFARWLCDLYTLANEQCDDCPAHRWCSNGWNGYRDLLQKNYDIVAEAIEKGGTHEHI